MLAMQKYVMKRIANNNKYKKESNRLLKSKFKLSFSFLRDYIKFANRKEPYRLK